MEQARSTYCKPTLPWLGRGVFDSNNLRLRLGAFEPNTPLLRLWPEGFTLEFPIILQVPYFPEFSLQK